MILKNIRNLPGKNYNKICYDRLEKNFGTIGIYLFDGCV